MLNHIQSFVRRRFIPVITVPAIVYPAEAVRTPMALRRPDAVPAARIAPTVKRHYVENILTCRRRRARRRRNRH